MKGEYDYVDSFKGQINNPSVDVYKVLEAFFKSTPKWIDTLFKIRNKLVSVFGLKNDIVDIDEIPSPLKVGDKVGFFKIYEVNENEVILGEDDVHLDFRVSIHLEKDKNNLLSIKTLVKFKNIFGKLYFVLIKPFHIIIVQSMLKNIKRQLAV